MQNDVILYRFIVPRFHVGSSFLQMHLESFLTWTRGQVLPAKCRLSLQPHLREGDLPFTGDGLVPSKA